MMEQTKEKRMRSRKTLERMLEELRCRCSSSSNMNYEIGGAIDALKWVLRKEEFLASGLR